MRPWSIEECEAYAQQLRDKTRASTAEHAAQAIEYLLGLVQPEQEPVAWMQEMPTKGDETRSVRLTTVEALAREEWGNPIPLYTTPPHREWQGLTEDEVAQAMFRADAIFTGPMQFKFAKEIEAKLKEKNG